MWHYSRGHLAHGWAKCHALKPCMTWVDEVKAWKTHGIGLPCVKVVGIRCPTPNSNQMKGKGEIISMVEKEGKKAKKKRREKGRRKEEERKEKRRSWSALQQVGSSPTWDTLV